MAASRILRFILLGNANGANQAINSVGRTASGVFAGIGKLGAGVGVAGAVAAIGKIGMAYEDNLNVLAATSGASAAEMAKVRSTAQQLGSDLSLPGTSAATAAAAMLELSKGGLNVTETMDAAKGSLQLAAAAGIDGARAAEIQAAALSQFGLKGKDATKVADTLANVAAAGSGGIEDVANAMKYIGPVASAMGVKVTDAGTAIGLLAKNGIIGEQAGTSMRGVLAGLAAPSEGAAAALEKLGIKAFDQQGNFKGLGYVTEQLAAAKSKLTAEEFAANAAMAFGREPLSAINALAKEGAAGFDAMGGKVAKAGGAADAAAAQNAGLKGALDGLKSQLEGVAIQLYERFAPGLTDAVRGISGLSDEASTVAGILGDVLAGAMRIITPIFQTLADNGTAVKSVLVGLAAGWAAYRTVVLITSAVQLAQNAIMVIQIARLQGLAAAHIWASRTSRSLAVVTGALNAVMAMNPVGLVVIAIIALAAGFAYAWKNSETFRDVVTTVFVTVGKAVLTAVDVWLGAWEKLARAGEKIPWLGDKFKGVADQIAGARDKVRGLKDKLDQLKSKTIVLTVETRQRMASSAALRDAALARNAIRRASGGPASGLVMVGEQGPELVDLPARSSVVSASATRRQGGGVTINGGVQISVSGARDPAATARAVRAELLKLSSRGTELAFS